MTELLKKYKSQPVTVEVEDGEEETYEKVFQDAQDAAANIWKGGK